MVGGLLRRHHQSDSFLVICGPKKSLHILMNGLLGALIGALIFLIIVLDHPFSGWFKVSSGPFEISYQQLMK